MRLRRLLKAALVYGFAGIVLATANSVFGWQQIPFWQWAFIVVLLGTADAAYDALQ
jgi:hypothetical protein